jgi:hypothetical protein
LAADHGDILVDLLIAGWFVTAGDGKITMALSWRAIDHKSLGFNPVCLAIRANIFGPISSESSNDQM